MTDTTPPLPSEQLHAIKARARVATPGPWKADGLEISSPTMWVGETCDPADLGRSRADAEFIAHAREDVPALLAEVDRLRAELAQHRDRVLTEAAAMIRAHCPQHTDGEAAFMSCHCPAATELDRTARTTQ